MESLKEILEVSNEAETSSIADDRYDILYFCVKLKLQRKYCRRHSSTIYFAASRSETSDAKQSIDSSLELKFSPNVRIIYLSLIIVH
jgi:hypothetical protein